jgi:3-deoxy-D-manno-octulosonic-acid transferase
MYPIYNLLVHKANLFLKIKTLFDPKIKEFMQGRKETFQRIKEGNLKSGDEVVWVHAASLGEFEQGRPIIEKIRKQQPDSKIVLTFFSPSGYNVRKDYKEADIVCYLPMDTCGNINKFLDMVKPTKAIIVKYEIWPNLLRGLKKRNINTIMVSGIFRKEQLFFKSYGGFMREALKSFSFLFVQDENSKKLLNSIGIENTEVTGDSRFDRVFEITQQNNELDFVTEFVDGKHTLVCGSSWKDDEDLLVAYINNHASDDEKIIIAPHNIKGKGIEDLKNSIDKKVVLFSEKEGKNMVEYDVFIIDTIGILTKIYSYADVAYVGGGYTKSGIHNILEPATFGVPILIGPNYYKFKEAKDLIELGGCMVADNKDKIKGKLKEFLENKEKREEIGKISGDYVQSKLGATKKAFDYFYGAS